MAKSSQEFLDSPEFKEHIRQQNERSLSKNKDKSGFEVFGSDIGSGFDTATHLVESALNVTSSFFNREFEDIPEIMNPSSSSNYSEFYNLAGSVAAPDGILPKLAITSSQFVGLSQPQMLDVIRTQDPQAVFNKDKYNNVIVTFGNGTQGYVNKPGLSNADVNSFMGLSKIFQMLPFEKVRKFVAPLGGSPVAGAIKDIGAKGVMFGGVSIGQDLVAIPLGSKQGVDNNKFFWNVVGGAVGAPLVGYGVSKLGGLTGWTVNQGVNPLLNKVIKKYGQTNASQQELNLNTRSSIIAPWTSASIKKLQTYTDENGFISRKGIEQLEANDPELIDIFTQDELNIFGQSLEQSGGDYQKSKLFTLAAKHGIDLNAAQITGDPEELAKLEEAKKGSYGENLQKEILRYTTEQDQQLVRAAQNLFNDKSITIDSLRSNEDILNRVGTTVQNVIQDAEIAAGNIVDKNYEAISGNVTSNRRTTNLLNSNIQNILKTGHIDLETRGDKMPSTKDMVSTIQDFSKKMTGGAKLSNTPSTFALQELEEFRKILSTDLYQAVGNDRRGATLVLSEFDKFYEDTLDNAVRDAHLFTPEQRESVNVARQSFQDKDNVFGFSKKGHNKGITDYTGKWINDVLFNQSKSGLEVMEQIMGYNYLGKPKVSISRIDRIYDAIQYLPNSEEVLLSVKSDFKDAYLSNLLKNSIVEKDGELVLNIPKYIGNINRFTDNDLGMELTNKILSPEEITNLKSFGTILQKTAPGKQFINYSNTASSIARIFESNKTLSALAKTGAYDAYGLKGLFTFRAFSSLKTAPSIDKARMLGNILNPAFEFTEAQQQALNRGIYGTLVNTSTPDMTGLEEAFGERIPRVKSRNNLKEISLQVNPNQYTRNEDVKKMLRLFND